MPLGAVTIFSQTGSAPWHILHRDRTISSTLAKVGAVDSDPLLISLGPAAESSAMAIMPAPATPHTHHGDFRPACRSLKKCRMIGPRASTMATISQLKRVA